MATQFINTRIPVRLRDKVKVAAAAKGTNMVDVWDEIAENINTSPFGNTFIEKNKNDKKRISLF